MREDIDKESRRMHFSALAKRFALDATLLRCRAAVHVENKDDIAFWGTMLKHCCPQDRFHFITASRNEYGSETSGVTQALKYYEYLNPRFFICIDSDYRYLMQERGIDAGHYVLQTYTYSFENHLCFAEGLDEVCRQVTHLPNTVFDFKAFLAAYSRTIYELFIWHLYFLESDPARFTKYEFNKYINIASCKRKFSIEDNAATAIQELKEKTNKRMEQFKRRYLHADLDFIRKRYARLGLTPENTYFFIRGHNIYDMISCVCKEVCKALLKKAEHSSHTLDAIAALYKDRNNVDQQLKHNLKFGAYPAIRQIEKDIRKVLD